MHVLLTATLALVATVSGTSASHQAEATPSDAKVLSVLLRASALSLPATEASMCRKVACEDNLGNYLALLIAEGGMASTTGTPRSLRLSCASGVTNGEIFPNQFLPDGDGFWICSLAATVDPDGESPWNYELRFLLSKPDLTLDPTRMWCPGAP